MLDSESLEKAKNVQLGLQQFENAHSPVLGDDKLILCGTCEVDFPCDRMLLFMLLQGIASFSAMIPTGNMAAMLGRFGNKK